MNKKFYTDLQIREIFHLEFLRRFDRKIKAGSYAVKGGANFRFFFKSVRYSEDMDIDIKGVRVDALQGAVMSVLENADLKNTLRSYDINDIVPPDMARAKQTETTQRFKVHLITFSGEDLFTKVEFSRRGIRGSVVTEDISVDILHAYKMPPLIAPHYDASSAAAQKIKALVTRTAIQARDVFDLYIIAPQLDSEDVKANKNDIQEAHDNLFQVNFEQFRDTVVSYLKPEDQKLYGAADRWDEIKLNVASFLENAGGPE